MSDLLIMQRSGNMLAPTDKDGLELVQSMGGNEMVSVKISRPRNIRFHRLFFKMLQEVYKAQPPGPHAYKDLRDMLDDIKVALGYAKKKVVNGREFWVPASISFARMDETKFTRFYEEFLDYCLRVIIPAINKPDFERHLLSIADGRDYSEDVR